MQAVELMKTHVVKIAADASLSEAIDLMDLYQTSVLPVVDDDDRLCGILTESDIFRVAVDHSIPSDGKPIHACFIAAARELGSDRVGDHMQCSVQSVTEECDVRDAIVVLLRHKLKSLPVVTQGRQVVGLLHRLDVYQAAIEGNL